MILSFAQLFGGGKLAVRFREVLPPTIPPNLGQNSLVKQCLQHGLQSLENQQRNGKWGELCWQSEPKKNIDEWMHTSGNIVESDFLCASFPFLVSQTTAVYSGTKHKKRLPPASLGRLLVSFEPMLLENVETWVWSQSQAITTITCLSGSVWTFKGMFCKKTSKKETKKHITVTHFVPRFFNHGKVPFHSKSMEILLNQSLFFSARHQCSTWTMHLSS